MKFQTLVIVVAILLNTFIQRVSADDIRPGMRIAAPSIVQPERSARPAGHKPAGE